MTTTIRRACSKDAEAICEIHKISIARLCAKDYSAEEIHLWTEGLHPGLIRSALSQRGVVGFVAERDGTMVGFAVLDTNVIRAIYVHPDFAGRGIGTRLLKRLEDTAFSRGVIKLRLSASLNSRFFYEANGYIVATKGKYPLSETRTLACLEMEKDRLDDWNS